MKNFAYTPSGAYAQPVKHIYTRPLRVHDPQDVARCEQAFVRANALLEDECFSWPGTSVMVAEKHGKPILYQPVFTNYVLGSLGPGELGALATDLASAQHQIVASVVYESRKAGYGEVLFMGGNARTEAFALRHDFEPTKYPMFRMRLT